MFTLPETFGVRQMVTMALLRERRNPETNKLEYQITDLGIQAALLVRKDPAETPSEAPAGPEIPATITPPSV